MKNTIILGVIFGSLAPLLAFVLVKYFSIQTFFLPDKPLAVYVLAAVFNLVIFRLFYRTGKDVLAKGILLITFLAMILLIFGTGLKV